MDRQILQTTEYFIHSLINLLSITKSGRCIQDQIQHSYLQLIAHHLVNIFMVPLVSSFIMGYYTGEVEENNQILTSIQKFMELLQFLVHQTLQQWLYPLL